MAVTAQAGHKGAQCVLTNPQPLNAKSPNPQNRALCMFAAILRGYDSSTLSLTQPLRWKVEYIYAKKNVYLGIIEGINPEHNVKGQSQLRFQACEGIQVVQEEGTGQEDAEPDESQPNIHNRSTLHDLKKTP